MRIESERYGTIDVDPAMVLRFARGLLGRPDLRRFVLLDFEAGIPLRWLQSVDDPSFGLPLGDPSLFRPEAALTLPAVQRQVWGLARPERADLWIIATIGPTGSWLLGNLLAPLLIDHEVGAGVQVVREAPLSDLRVPVNLAAFAAARRARAGRDLALIAQPS